MGREGLMNMVFKMKYLVKGIGDSFAKLMHFFCLIQVRFIAFFLHDEPGMAEGIIFRHGNTLATIHRGSNSLLGVQRNNGMVTNLGLGISKESSQWTCHSFIVRRIPRTLSARH